jgi:hypothetical protein
MERFNLKKKYLESFENGLPYCSKKLSGIWQGRIKTINPSEISVETSRNSTRFVVGNGESVHFWNDTWLGGSSLKHRHLRLYRLSARKLVTISNMGSWYNGFWTWQLGCTREF